MTWLIRSLPGIARPTATASTGSASASASSESASWERVFWNTRPALDLHRDALAQQIEEPLELRASARDQDPGDARSLRLRRVELERRADLVDEARGALQRDLTDAAQVEGPGIILNPIMALRALPLALVFGHVIGDDRRRPQKFELLPPLQALGDLVLDTRCHARSRG